MTNRLFTSSPPAAICWAVHAALGLGLLAASNVVMAAPYVATHDVVLQYQAVHAAEITRVELWLSIDGGRTWQPTDVERTGTALRFRTEHEGRNDVFVVLHNAAGPSSDPPTAGAKPTATVYLDTTAPLVQLHAARIETSADQPPRLVLRATLVEENLSGGGLRLFYRGTDPTWHDGGPVTRGDGVLIWHLPPALPATFDVRVVATDLAGNAASADLANVSGPAPAPDEPAEKARDAAATASGAVLVEHVEPVRVEKAAILDPNISTSQPATDPAPGASRDVQKLSNLADRLVTEGRYSLAAARLEEASRLAPSDPDVLVKLGSALYRLDRFDDAQTRFAAAAQAAPESPAALEGLALVAATQKRYPEAREQLQRLLRLQPESSNAWLRLGDVEQRLGHTAQAVDAWERALQMPTSDAALREKAQRRLEYFRTERHTDSK
jgi:Flp pilus assembly protein TadD